MSVLLVGLWVSDGRGLQPKSGGWRWEGAHSRRQRGAWREAAASAAVGVTEAAVVDGILATHWHDVVAAGVLFDRG